MTQLAKLSTFLALAFALSGCFVNVGGSQPLDPSNPNSPQVGGNVSYNVSTGAIYPGLSIGAGPFYVGL